MAHTTEHTLKDELLLLCANKDLHGYDFCEAYTKRADTWLQHLFEQITAKHPRGLALLAVGGYGRRELTPGSDLDVMLLHDKGFQADDIANKLWYPVWDSGIRLDYSVRSINEALQVANTDLRAALGLTSVRLVAGDQSLSSTFTKKMARQWRTQARQWLPELIENAQRRSNHYGDVAFLLEPDIKEAHGGLRDAAILRALDYSGLLGSLSIGNIDNVDSFKFPRALAVLTQVRVELQRETQHPSNRLVLQEQDRIAEALGYPDADALMADVSSAGRYIAHICDELWQRLTLEEEYTPHRFNAMRMHKHRWSRWLSQTDPKRKRRIAPIKSISGGAQEVETDIMIRAGEVVLAPTASVEADPTLLLRFAAVAAEHDLPLARSSLAQLSSSSVLLATPWTEEMRLCFIRLLAAGKPAIPVIETLDFSGMWEAFLPEWKLVRNKPQRNAYHRFTVDRHLLETAANAAELAYRVQHPDLLLMAALLHDIGKGQGRDHTITGIELAQPILERMGFSKDQINLIIKVIDNHLLLADTSTRRDLDDPTTIDHVAATVGDRETLELLSALTEADGLATGPTAFTPWRAELLRDLVGRVASRLSGEPLPSPPSLPTEQHRKMMAEHKLVVLHDGSTVTVIAPDRHGLLATVSGVLALHGLDIRSATIAGEEGMALEIFHVEPSRHHWPDWGRLRSDLEAALASRLPLEAKLTERARTYAVEHRKSPVRPNKVQISVDNQASKLATVVEIRSRDEIGLLHAITQALTSCELDVVSARVATMGHEVIDAFYVTTSAGEKLWRAQDIQLVEATVKQKIEQLMERTGTYES
ncbi:MAG: [protein-PII] uridylyltransferase [Actinobacteria bacterium]|jgi:[protein-PII] uridylyltransferase|nr:[protein-PII] uridylyltransferase [Actinomycetota bacterium]